MTDTADWIARSATEFYRCLKADENGRYRSWEHCYAHFMKARSHGDADCDYLSLQLAFYLASWGMYRGSSFLLQKDYRIHIPVVKELLRERYDPLAGMECAELRKESNQELLWEIVSFLEGYYDKIRREVKGREPKYQLSDTLVTKILMGTLGCVPAYDRYFIAGVKSRKAAAGSFSMKSVLQLADFYERNRERLERARGDMEVSGMPYPQMKLLDMGFWQLGFELDAGRDAKADA